MQMFIKEDKTFWLKFESLFKYSYLVLNFESYNNIVEKRRKLTAVI